MGGTIGGGAQASAEEGEVEVSRGGWLQDCPFVSQSGSRTRSGRWLGVGR